MAQAAGKEYRNMVVEVRRKEIHGVLAPFEAY
jgi:hypothetical protein